MSRNARATGLAVVLLTATLAAPAGAIAARPADGPATVAIDAREAGGWLASLLDSAWGWLRALVDEDNGNIAP